MKINITLDWKVRFSHYPNVNSFMTILHVQTNMLMGICKISVPRVLQRGEMMHCSKVICILDKYVSPTDSVMHGLTGASSFFSTTHSIGL